MEQFMVIIWCVGLIALIAVMMCIGSYVTNRAMEPRVHADGNPATDEKAPLLHKGEGEWKTQDSFGDNNNATTMV